jgi:hypothetical protein
VYWTVPTIDGVVEDAGAVFTLDHEPINLEASTHYLNTTSSACVQLFHSPWFSICKPAIPQIASTNVSHDDNICWKRAYGAIPAGNLSQCVFAVPVTADWRD